MSGITQFVIPKAQVIDTTAQIYASFQHIRALSDVATFEIEHANGLYIVSLGDSKVQYSLELRPSIVSSIAQYKYLDHKHIFTISSILPLNTQICYFMKIK